MIRREKDYQEQIHPCRGAAIVEFALVAPMFFLFVLGLIEFARMEMVEQALTGAAHEGCRSGIVPGSNSSDVLTQTNDVLKGSFISGTAVTVTPPEIATLKKGQPVTVSIQVPFERVSWLPTPLFFKGKVLKTQCTMLRESK